MSDDRHDPWGLGGDQGSTARQRALESRLDEIAAEIGRLRRQRAEAIEEFRTFTTAGTADAGGTDAAAPDGSAPSRSYSTARRGLGTLETLAAELADRGSRTSSRVEPFQTRELAPGIVRSPFVSPRRRPRRIFRLVVPALLLVAGAASVPWIAGLWTPTSEPSGMGPAALIESRPPPPGPGSVDVPSLARGVEAPPEPVGTSGATPSRPLTLELTTIREVWIRSRVDDQPASARILPGARVFTLEAERFVEVRVGDAGAVTLRLNGVERGPLGRSGEVLTRRFEADLERPRF